MSTSLIIQTEDHITGSAQQMTVTDINPNATNADLLTFAQMTAGLSKDTYVKSARVDKVELDTEKTPRTINLRYTRKTETGGYNSFEVPQDGIITIPQNLVYNNSVPFTFDMDCEGLAPQFLNFSATNNITLAQVTFYKLNGSISNQWQILFATNANAASRQPLTVGTASFTFHIEGTDQIAEFNRPVIITITEEG